MGDGIFYPNLGPTGTLVTGVRWVRPHPTLEQYDKRDAETERESRVRRKKLRENRDQIERERNK